VTKKLNINELAFSYVKFLIFSLLFFGTYFSKFNLVGPVYLYDLMLLIPILFILWNIKINKNNDFGIVLVIIISISYLFYSLLNLSVGADILLRQFMLFGYLLAAFVYVNYIRRIENFSSRIIQFLKYFGNVSAIIQCLYLFYVLLFVTRNIFEEGAYYYYSSITVLGLLIFAVDKLIYSKFFLLYSCLAFFLLSTTGHSSAFLAYFIVFVLYFLGKMNKLNKLIIFIVFFVIAALIVLKTSFFTDANAQWRLVYWGLTLKGIFVDRVGIFGMGFGVPYSDDEVAYILQVVNGFTAQQSDDLEKYLSPMHNSFITIAFHIGFAFSFFIIYPLLKILVSIISGRFKSNLNFLFLSLTLVAFSVWSATNVILELPHSSLLYWLLFLAFIYLYPEFSKINSQILKKPI
jgi:hypothetical protein